MRTESFDYVLPEELIAREPVSPRDACRLMVLDRHKKSIEDHIFHEIIDVLRPGDVLVFNDSRVIPARLLIRYNNRLIEVFLTKRLNELEWLALVRPGRIFKPGTELKVSDELSFTVEEIQDDGQRLLRFSEGDPLQHKVLRHIGAPPYPPYIKETKASFDDYQTVYARDEGSVAAPTAGLHFTERLLDDLHGRGVQLEFVTLHVGLGTFLPLKADKVEDHFMHSESYSLGKGAADRLNTAHKEKRRIIAVGTTAVRVLEDSFEISQGFQAGERETNIFIYPGYEWKCVDGLITNFHLPKSSLLLLTCSFGGTDFVLDAYKKAVENSYRFYSFGDAMFIV